MHRRMRWQGWLVGRDQAAQVVRTREIAGSETGRNVVHDKESRRRRPRLEVLHVSILVSQVYRSQTRGGLGRRQSQEPREVNPQNYFQAG